MGISEQRLRLKWLCSTVFAGVGQLPLQSVGNRKRGAPLPVDQDDTVGLWQRLCEHLCGASACRGHQDDATVDEEAGRQRKSERVKRVQCIELTGIAGAYHDDVLHDRVVLGEGEGERRKEGNRSDNLPRAISDARDSSPGEPTDTISLPSVVLGTNATVVLQRAPRRVLPYKFYPRGRAELQERLGWLERLDRATVVRDRLVVAL